MNVTEIKVELRENADEFTKTELNNLKSKLGLFEEGFRRTPKLNLPRSKMNPTITYRGQTKKPVVFDDIEKDFYCLISDNGTNLRKAYFFLLRNLLVKKTKETYISFGKNDKTQFYAIWKEKYMSEGKSNMALLKNQGFRTAVGVLEEKIHDFSSNIQR